LHADVVVGGAAIVVLGRAEHVSRAVEEAASRPGGIGDRIVACREGARRR
jgi:hypothetical protein